jgi:acyl-CoA synthetase (AMP-forming)/AMP-acid ligase II
LPLGRASFPVATRASWSADLVTVLARIVDEAAERFGDRTAYVEIDGTRITYRELRGRSLSAAHMLREEGVGEGDVVALVLPATTDYVATYLGAARIGAITAGVNTRLTSDERAELLSVVEPKLVVEQGHFDLGAGDVTPPPPLGADPHRAVAIVFTSGTTGVPKAAVFAERQLEAITAIDTGGRWDTGGAQLAGNSFASLGPMTKLPGSLMRGGTTHLVDRWRAHDALELTERHELSSVAGIPTQIALMLRQPDFDSFDLSSVKAIVMGGGPATPALVREARDRFGAALAVRYSCTEAGIGLGTAFDGSPEDAEISVGRPHPGVELIIVDDELRPIGPGEVGEVCLRSAAVMSGYWRDAEATAAAFTPDGYVRTGDLGWLDTEGRLRLAGRRKEMYVRGGYNVYPIEVESVLAEHPDVAEIAVIPRADDVMGEVGVAFVVARTGATAPSLDALRAFGQPRLAHHKLPEQLAVVDALPLTPAEKIDRGALARHLRS